MNRHIKMDTYESFESLCKLLNGNFIGHDNVTGFTRSFTFECYLFNSFYENLTIVWYKNQSYLKMGETQINFTHASIDGCWPNRCSKNLNLSNDGKDTHAVIALEKSH